MAIAPLAAGDNAGPPPAEFAAYLDEPPQMRSGAIGKSGFLRLGFERRGDRTILADLQSRTPYLAQRALALRRGTAGHGVGVHDHDGGLRTAGRSNGAGSRARTGRESARHDAVGDQDPHDGRQLRAADTGVHARRRRVSRVSSRPADPAPPCAVRERHTDHAAPDRISALLGDRAIRDASTIIRTSVSARRCCRSRPRLRGPAGRRCSSRSC